ncbi:MAG: type III-A CRISPR-associated protein Csm2 [Candidatus Altiarchaeota archaeon]
MNGGKYEKKDFNEEVRSLLNDEEIDKILNLKDENVELFVKKAEECAKEFKFSASKLRSFYDPIKGMKEYQKIKLYLLKPKIAYAVGKEEREKRLELKKFQKTMEKLIEKTNENNFENFKSFFEAIVAYHKIYGGKKWN